MKKIILCIIVVIVILYSGILLIDMGRVKSLNKPIFAIENGYMDSMIRFDGLGQDINATTGEITYGQMSGLGKTIIKVCSE